MKMVLVDWEIEELLEDEVIFGSDKSLINPSSLDIRIGDTALVEVKGAGFQECSWFGGTSEKSPYLMKPNEVIMTSTYEKLELPPDIACELKLKSSRARQGLSHALAGWIDNGFHGNLTLELKNYNCENRVGIYPGMKIGQLIFHKTKMPKKSYSGRYGGYDRVVGYIPEKDTRIETNVPYCTDTSCVKVS